MDHWFRYYDGALNDPKVQMLPGETFKAWVNLLCLASANDGEIPNLDAAAFALRMSRSKVAALVIELATVELLDAVPGRYYAPHNWNGRQYKSDVTDPTAPERMKRYRRKRKEITDTVTDGSVTVTGPRADTEQITDSEQSRESARPRELPNDWKPSAADIDAAKSIGLTSEDIETDAAKFGSHYRARGEKRADWSEQWVKWCHGTAEKKGRKPPGVVVAEIGFYASDGSLELSAWDDHNKKSKGASMPRDRNGGWRVPAQWPPGFDPLTIPGFLKRTA